MWGWLSGIDWTATGVFAISVWQAVKEFRTRSVTKPKPKVAPPTVRCGFSYADKNGGWRCRLQQGHAGTHLPLDE